tara:strand:+ start:2295 stop:2981 length:687 start_codon:yes stop_codon:yes gene_type:complete
MKTAVIIFSRLGSSRLPGKALKVISGKTLIDRVVDRVLKVKGQPMVVVAASENCADDGLVEHLQRRGIDVFRGPSEDVAARAGLCADYFKLDQFVRISGDSPFIEPGLIDLGLERAYNEEIDLVTNVFPRTFPAGASVEIIRTKAFKKVLECANDPYDREHITSYFYKNPNEFRIANFLSPDCTLGKINLAVDTIDDLKRACWMIETFGENLDLNLAAEKSCLWRPTK